MKCWCKLYLNTNTLVAVMLGLVWIVGEWSRVGRKLVQFLEVDSSMFVSLRCMFSIQTGHYSSLKKLTLYDNSSNSIAVVGLVIIFWLGLSEEVLMKLI